jgi:hypothetical protein
VFCHCIIPKTSRNCYYWYYSSAYSNSIGVAHK